MAERPPYPGMPRWLKVSGILVIVLVLLVAALLVTGAGGDHGPGRHSGGGGNTPATSVPAGHIPPAGGH